MKFAGSERVKLVCYSCEKESRTFLVTLTEEDGSVCWEIRNDVPSGWWIEDEAEDEAGIIYGFCPDCITEKKRKDFVRLMSPNARTALARLTGKLEEDIE